MTMPSFGKLTTLVVLFGAFCASFGTLSAVEPISAPNGLNSTIDKCYYRVIGKKAADGSAVDSGWVLTNCANAVDFATVNPAGDGVYYLYMAAVDRNNIGVDKYYSLPATNELNANPPPFHGDKKNKLGVFKYGPYKIDTRAPSCNLQSIRFHNLGNSNGIHLYGEKLYYKNGASGLNEKMTFTIASSESGSITGCDFYGNTDAYCQSGLQKIGFENLMSPGTTFSYTPYKQSSTESWQYSWNSSTTYSGNIIRPNADSRCFDVSGNSGAIRGPVNVLFDNTDPNVNKLTCPTCTGSPTVICQANPNNCLSVVPDNGAPPTAETSMHFDSGNFGGGADEKLFSGPGQTKYLAADGDRKISFVGIGDPGADPSGLRDFDLYIESSGSSSCSVANRSSCVKYSFSNTRDANGNVTVRIPSTVSINHNFSMVDTGPAAADFNPAGYREYTFFTVTKKNDGSEVIGQLCDEVGNCSGGYQGTIRVVANEPDMPNSPYSDSSSTVKIGNANDPHEFQIAWKDVYGNSILPVAGVKQTTTLVNFTNNLGADQVTAGKNVLGDGVNFVFRTGGGAAFGGAAHSPTQKKNFVFINTNASEYPGGVFRAYYDSIVPTKNEYTFGSGSAYPSSRPANLKEDDLIIRVEALNSYTSVGQRADTDKVTTDVDFKFSPAVNFPSLETLAPVTEGVPKLLTFGRSYNGAATDWYQLRVRAISNNAFLNWTDFHAVKDGTASPKVNRYALIPSSTYGFFVSDKTPNSPVSCIAYSSTPGCTFSEDATYGGDTDYDLDFLTNGTAQELGLTARTIGGVTAAKKDVALYSLLRYKTAPAGIDRFAYLPSMSSGADGDKILDLINGVYSPATFVYGPNSKVNLSEIDIRGIAQTGMRQNLTDTAGSVVSSEASTKFRDVSSITLYDLRTDVNKNVAALLAGIDRSDAVDGVTGGSAIVNSLAGTVGTQSDTGKKLMEGNLAYFKDTDVEINCGAVCTVGGKKTIIIENGDLTISSDMKYDPSNSKSVLGIILIGNKDGTKNRLKIKESVTNGVGVVYSEGPIVSVNAAGTIYDGSNIAERNLLNQLYWKGSWATRNTIGKSISTPPSCPYGTLEYASGCNEQKARAYDLIYLRRYVRVDALSTYSADLSPSEGGLLPYGLDLTSVKVAGGSTYSLAGGVASKTSGTLPVPAKNNLNAPLILEYDQNLQTDPPYGFGKSQ